jgi:hypothetical protein
MAQKRTDYSKFTQPNGTIQVLMLWASVALHLMIGSNLGLFGRLDPIKVKPAGGTVRVVDLTPAEQTRVPEAAKSKSLPIAQTPVNPEPATRNLVNPSNLGRSGASTSVPPRINRPQLPSPSSQLPRTPSVNNFPPVVQPPIQRPPQSPPNDKSNNPLTIPKQPKPPRTSQEDGQGRSDQGSDSGVSGGTKKRTAPDIDDRSSSSSNLGPDTNQSDNGRKRNNDNNKPPPDRKDPPDAKVNDSVEEQKEINTVLSNLRANGKVIVQLQIPSESLQISRCETYKKIRILWPIDTNGELEDTTPIILPYRKINEEYADPAKSLVKKAYEGLPVVKRKSLANKFADYSFKIPFGKCGA